MQTADLRSPLLVLAAVGGLVAQSLLPSPEINRALAAISSNSLRANLSFLSSEELEGRDTPSRGLDLAAVYIAAQFRGAGLEPAGDNGYFQTAKMLRIEPGAERVRLEVQAGGVKLAAPQGEATVVSRRPMELSGVRVVKISRLSDVGKVALQQRVAAIRAGGAGTEAILKAAVALHPAALLEIAADGATPARLIDDGAERARYGEVPRLTVRDAGIVRMVEGAKDGETDLTLSVRVTSATVTPVTVRNVAGLLRGSDPVLRDRYVLLSAHYDHLGADPDGRVFPGANDDGSGTVSVIEIARAVAGMPVHPKRSILFLAFFGEEEGSLGSRYYTSHPLEPLAKTVVDINLEQLGRTDAIGGSHVADATLTGFGYSSVARTLQKAGAATGVKVYDTSNGDDYFDRSDNLTFAEHGIPAHTVVVALEFPGYHGIGDVWQKIDYGNMAKVDRMLAFGLIMMADSAAAPSWNRMNPRVKPYVTGH